LKPIAHPLKDQGMDQSRMTPGHEERNRRAKGGTLDDGSFPAAVLQKLREVFSQNRELAAHAASEKKVFAAELKTNDFEKLGKLG